MAETALLPAHLRRASADSLNSLRSEGRDAGSIVDFMAGDDGTEDAVLGPRAGSDDEPLDRLLRKSNFGDTKFYNHTDFRAPDDPGPSPDATLSPGSEAGNNSSLTDPNTPNLAVKTGLISSAKKWQRSSPKDEVVHRSTWTLRRTRPAQSAFAFVVPGDFGVVSVPSAAKKGASASAAVETSSLERSPSPGRKSREKRRKSSLDALGKGIGKIWAKTVGLTKFGKSVIHPAGRMKEDEGEVSPQSIVSHDSTEWAVSAVSGEVCSSPTGAASMLSPTETSASEETQTEPTPVESTMVQTEGYRADFDPEFLLAASSMDLSLGINMMLPHTFMTPVDEPLVVTHQMPANDPRSQAARLIQRAWRKHLLRATIKRSLSQIHVRFVVTERRKAAVRTIRRFWRRIKLNRELDRRVAFERGRKEAAARKIQRAWNAHRLRETIAKRIEQTRLRKGLEARFLPDNWGTLLSATLVIQRSYRRWKTRMENGGRSPDGRQLKRGDSQMIIAAWRGRMLRSEINFRIARKRQRRNEAATKIQRAWRNYIACKEPRQELARLRRKSALAGRGRSMHHRSSLSASAIRQPSTPRRLRNSSVSSVLNAPTAATIAKQHSRRVSIDSTKSHASSNSRFGDWNPDTHVEHQEVERLRWEKAEEPKPLKKDEGPKFKFTKGGGVFTDYGVGSIMYDGPPAVSESKPPAVPRSRNTTPMGRRTVSQTPLGSKRTSILIKDDAPGALPGLRGTSKERGRGRN